MRKVSLLVYSTTVVWGRDYVTPAHEAQCAQCALIEGASPRRKVAVVEHIEEAGVQGR
jgi:hypothetical protein